MGGRACGEHVESMLRTLSSTVGLHPVGWHPPVVWDKVTNEGYNVVCSSGRNQECECGLVG